MLKRAEETESDENSLPIDKTLIYKGLFSTVYKCTLLLDLLI